MTKGKKIKITVKKDVSEKKLPKKMKKLQEGLSLSDIKLVKKKQPKNVFSKVVRIIEKSKKTDRKSFWFGFGVVIFGLFLGIFFSYFLFWQFFCKKDNIIRFIPEEAIFYSWIDPSFRNALFKTGDFSNLEEDLQIKLDEVLNPYQLNFKEDLEPILGDEVALAILPDKEKAVFLGVIKLKNKDLKSNLEKKLVTRNTKEETYSGIKIVSPLNDSASLLKFSYIFLEDYLVLSKEPSFLKNIIDVKQGKRSSLAESSKYKKFSHILPYSYSFYLFVEPDQFVNRFVSSEESTRYIFLKIFTFNIKEASLSLKLSGKNLIMRTYINKFKEGNNYPLKLVNYIPLKTILSFSGYNLEKEFEDLKNQLTSYNPLYLFYLTNLKEKIQKQYGLDIEDDLLSWMDKEYNLLVQSKSENEFSFGFIFQIDDIKKVQEKLAKLENVIENYYSQKYPKESNIILEDGTTAVELLPNTEAFQFKDLDFKDIKIRTISIPETFENFSYAFYGNLVVFGTAENLVMSMVDACKGENQLIKEEKLSKLYQRAFKKSNSFFYSDPEKTLELFKAPESFRDDFNSFDNFLINWQVRKEEIFGKGFFSIK